MTIDMSQFYQVFFDEAAEHLNEMEHLLLGLDVDAPNPDDLNAIFRAAHSIKGGSGTFGFTDMTEVTHILESLLDRLRKDELTLRREMINAFLEAGDVLKDQLAAHQNGGEANQEAATAVCNKLSSLTGDAPAAPPTTLATPVSEEAIDIPPAAEQRYRIALTIDAEGQKDINLDNLFADLGSLGRLDLTETTAEKKGKKKKKGARTWQLTLQTTAGEPAICDILDFVIPAEQYSITTESVPAPAAIDEDEGFGFFSDVETPIDSESEDAGYGFFTDTPAAAQEEQGYGFFQEVASPEPAAPQPESSNAPEKPRENEAKPAPRTGSKPAANAQAESATLRVNVEKVDQLINLVGELVITQAMLAQTSSQVDPVLYEKLINGLNQLERNTRDLQEAVMSIRMMPIGFVFNRFPRVVHDLATKLNKQVVLQMLGEGTELDKSLIEKITDPLTHLVRNSLDHGIETPEQRIAAGKPAQGTITLQAAHQGGNIVICVSDDGAGLRREKILAKAKEKGIPVSDNMPDSEVWQLIFAPGFSTADVITDVSGRGVGMDVVKRNIQAMGGQVDIESSAGYGSRVTIRLPLTLAILDGMSIAVGGEVFIIPLTFIAESLQPAPDDVKTIAGKGRVVHVRGEYLPLIALHELFGIAPRVTETHQGIVVLLETEGKRAALFVDELVGQHQVVIKSMETNYRKVAGISGATIMGDGKVALILDIGALVRLSQH